MITIQISNFNGQINVPAHVTANITSDIALKNIEWLCNKPVNYSVSQDQKTVNFTPSADGEYVFTATVWNISGERASSVGKVTVGTVSPTPTPAPTPTPSPQPTPAPAGTLWDSNINGKWNDGNKRVITTNEGGQKPDDKSIFCAASGSPKLIIDGDGVAHLQAGTGCDNLSIRLRSRHQGECNNVSLDPTKRFGGHGWAIDTKGAVDFKTEEYHNVHSNSHTFNSGINPGTAWHHVHQTCKGNESTFTIDGKSVGKVTVQNHGDDSLLAKNSYIWLRMNNSDHGRIYIMAINVDSALDFDFKFEANSIAFKNVKLVSI